MVRRGWALWSAIVCTAALCYCTDHTTGLVVGTMPPGSLVPCTLARQQCGMEAGFMGSIAGATHGRAWLRLRGGRKEVLSAGHVAAVGAGDAVCTATMVQEVGTGEWNADRVEEGFLELQGELAPFTFAEEGSVHARPEQQKALRQRVRDLSTCAITLFRSRMLLARQQRQRVDGGGQQESAPERGLLVLFEGLDRSGKGTQVQMLARALEVDPFCGLQCESPHARTHVHTRKRMRARTHAHTHAHTHTRLYTHAHTHIHIHTHTHTHAHSHRCSRMHTRILIWTMLNASRRQGVT